jgi:aromatic-L-amino-acid decarboxylase
MTKPEGDTDENPDARTRWEWRADEIRRIGYRTVDLIAEHLTRLSNSPVFRPFPRELAKGYLESAVPESGTSADEILSRFSSEIEPYPFGNGHPAFYGWVNSPPATIAIFAEALAAAMNPSCAGGNHAAVYVEHQVLNWFKQITGFPPESMGLLVSGGSAAALGALAVARHAKCGFDVRKKGVQSARSRLVVYQGGEAHGCHQKAVELLGIGSDNLRRVNQNRALQMLPSALDAALRRGTEDGDTPVAVIATAGTVNTGAIDPLDEIADVCRQHRAWLHVDGAYGAPAILTSKYSAQLSGLSRADSLTLDPHKWLYIPVEAGLVLVRDAEAMRAAFSLVPPYLRTDGNVDGVAGPVWFSEFGFQQTRGFRALKIWMALTFHGLAGYRAAIERDIRLAEMLAQSVRGAHDFQLFEPQSLSIVCFRYLAPDIRPDNSDGRYSPEDRTDKIGEQYSNVTLEPDNKALSTPRPNVPDGSDKDAVDDQRLNSINKSVLEKLQLSGRAFLSGTTIDGTFWLRACIINPRATEENIAGLLGLVREIALGCT